MKNENDGEDENYEKNENLEKHEKDINDEIDEEIDK